MEGKFILCIFLLILQSFFSPSFRKQLFSLGNPSKDRQRFVDATVMTSAPDWFKRLRT